MHIVLRMIHYVVQQEASWQRNQNSGPLHPSSGKYLHTLQESQG